MEVWNKHIMYKLPEQIEMQIHTNNYLLLLKIK